MKMVIAIIQPQQLPAVKQALFGAGLPHLTCTNILGTAPDRDQHIVFRGVDQPVTLFQKVRIGIAANEDMVETVIEAILRAAKETGGFGKIFVIELVEVVNLATGERGAEAV